jgi:hypothetical protein
LAVRRFADAPEARKSHAHGLKWGLAWDDAVLLFTRQSPVRERIANIAQRGVNE